MAQLYVAGVYYLLPAAIILITLVCDSNAIKCYQCGQYTDGVGSITPCLNFTEKNLKQCPKSTQHQCIKYVTEGSIVRECADECIEKRESWGTKVFCCNEDGCNLATPTLTTANMLITIVTIRIVVALVCQLFNYNSF